MKARGKTTKSGNRAKAQRSGGGTRSGAKRKQSEGTLGSLLSVFTGDPNDAVNMLKADHRKVEDLFSEYEDANAPDQKAEIAHTVCRELIVHSALEEQIFYPACREAGVDDKLMDEAQVEHDGAKVMIGELLTQSPGDEFYDAKFKVLSEYIKHHVREEEKFTGIFAKARSAGLDMSKLGERMMARKRELMERTKRMHLSPPKARSLRAVKIADAEDYRADPRERRGREAYSDQRNGDGYGRQNHGGWSGDDRRHAQAARRGWERRD